MTEKLNRYPEVEFSFETDLRIDKHNLDEELVSQANKMMRYSKAHAQAQFDRDRAKQNLDQCKARLDSEARDELNRIVDDKGKTVKYTEAVVDGKVKTHPDYLEAVDRYNKAEYKVNVMFGGVMAMNARRPLLEDLVRLYSQGYWSTPSVRGDRRHGLGQEATQTDTEAAIIRSQEAPLAGGYQPTGPPLDVSNQPQGGSGVPDEPKPALPTTKPTPRRPLPAATKAKE